jgi:hypothetical protein
MAAMVGAVVSSTMRARKPSATNSNTLCGRVAAVCAAAGETSASVAKIDVAKVDMTKIGMTKTGMTKIGMTKAGMTKTGIVNVDLAEIDRAKPATRTYRCIPLSPKLIALCRGQLGFAEAA